MYRIRFIQHVPGQGSYVVDSYFNSVVHGPDTLKACTRFIEKRKTPA